MLPVVPVKYGIARTADNLPKQAGDPAEYVAPTTIQYVILPSVVTRYCGTITNCPTLAVLNIEVSALESLGEPPPSEEVAIETSHRVPVTAPVPIVQSAVRSHCPAVGVSETMFVLPVEAASVTRDANPITVSNCSPCDPLPPFVEAKFGVTPIRPSVLEVLNLQSGI